MNPSTAALQNRALTATFFKIALPVALQNLLVFSVGLMDTVMVGALGETELSAVMSANQPAFILALCVFGLSSGAGVMLSQFWGKRDFDMLNRVLAFALKVSLIIGAGVFILCMAAPAPILRMYTNEEPVIRLGAEYIRVAAFSYVIFSFTGAYVQCVRNVERVAIAVVTNSVAFVVNVFFNYMFIFGKFGAPALGVVGAALGTVLARASELIIVLIYAFKIETRVKLRLSAFFKRDKFVAKEFRRYALPVVINETAWGSGSSAQTAIAGHMGVSNMAAYGVVINITQMMTVMLLAAGAATLVIVGKDIGEGNIKKAKKDAVRLIWYGIFLAVIFASVLMFLRPFFIWLFSFTGAFTEQTKQTIYSTLAVTAFIMVVSAIPFVCIIGVFRGGGDTIFAMWLDLLTLWCFSVPLGALCGLVLRWTLPWTFFILRSDEIVKSVLCILRLRGGKWVHDVTAAKT